MFISETREIWFLNYFMICCLDIKKYLSCIKFLFSEFQGDLSLALDPHPPPETPTCTESLDLSVLDPNVTITGDDQDGIEHVGQESSLRPHPSAQSQPLRDVTNRSLPSLTDRHKTPG